MGNKSTKDAAEKEKNIELLAESMESKFKSLNSTQLVTQLKDASSINDGGKIKPQHLIKAAAKNMEKSVANNPEHALKEDIGALMELFNSPPDQMVGNLPEATKRLSSMNDWLSKQQKPLSEENVQISKSLYVFARTVNLFLDANQKVISGAIFLGKIKKQTVDDLKNQLLNIENNSSEILAPLKAQNNLDGYFQKDYEKINSTKAKSTYLNKVESSLSDIIALKQMSADLEQIIETKKRNNLPSVINLKSDDPKQKELIANVMSKLPSDTQKLLREYIQQKEENAEHRDKHSYTFTNLGSSMKKKFERSLHDPVQDALQAFNNQIKAEIKAQARVITNDESFCNKLESASIKELSEIKDKIEPLRLINDAKQAIDAMSDELKKNNTLYTRCLVFLAKTFGFKTQTADLIIKATESRDLLNKIHAEMNSSMKDSQSVNFNSKTITTFLQKPADSISEKAHIQSLQNKFIQQQKQTSPLEDKKEDKQDSTQIVLR